MNIFWIWLVVGLLWFHCPSAFAGSGHDAGYQWAAEHGIDDPDYDDGNSESFNEGVREYAEEQSEEENE